MAEELSEFNQSSFLGGMNLLGDDTRLQPNQYRILFDATNRYDELQAVLQSAEDTAVPLGLKQEIVTFGNYIILFVAGKAYYRFYLDSGWRQILGFGMSPDAPRYWTIAIPVSTTNYARLASSVSDTDTRANAEGDIKLASIAGASAGNLPGLLVQDNISQPQFIFLDGNGVPTVRTTQSFTEWSITFTDATNTQVAVDVNNNKLDKREYVPIGNSMAWDDGVLYITSQDTNFIYPSVSGRPLDFVRNVTNKLADNTTSPPFTQVGGGDATTTSYSVGVGGITCLRSVSSGGIFVSAGNANFIVTKDMSNNAPKIFGEYKFIRTFLFNANCLSDRCIFDTTGDTRFIDLTGVRSFNAVEQEKNEGRNSVFTSRIQSAFSGITQDPLFSAAILYDNYELYAMSTIFGPAIAKYDTVNDCWTSFDVTQTGGKRIKILVKIELAIQRLYAITEDDRLFTLYIGPNPATGSVRTIGVCANILYGNENIKMNDPKSETQLRNTRVIVNKITRDCSVSFVPYVNNRLTMQELQTKNITYTTPVPVSNNSLNLPDVNTQVSNLLFITPSCGQGWKMFGMLSWTGGVITQYSFELANVSPMNPLDSQGTTV